MPIRQCLSSMHPVLTFCYWYRERDRCPYIPTQTHPTLLRAWTCNKKTSDGVWHWHYVGYSRKSTWQGSPEPHLWWLQRRFHRAFTCGVWLLFCADRRRANSAFQTRFSQTKHWVDRSVPRGIPSEISADNVDDDIEQTIRPHARYSPPASPGAGGLRWVQTTVRRRGRTRTPAGRFGRPDDGVSSSECRRHWASVRRYGLHPTAERSSSWHPDQSKLLVRHLCSVFLLLSRYITYTYLIF